MNAKDGGKTFDLLGLGAVSVDDFGYVESFPPPDVKTQILRTQRQCGGLTATALVAAARLGSKCAYAGVLGTDELSEFAISCLQEEGIDLTHLARHPGASVIHSFIVVGEDHHTRNVFSNRNGAVGAGDHWPDLKIITSSKILLVDHIGIPGMIRAASFARDSGIPVIGDFERAPGADFEKLLALVDHLILSKPFAQKFTMTSDPQAALKKLWTKERKAVVVTCGAEGCWSRWADGPGPPQHQPAFKVSAVDTTGCGDVFHGAYASALARGMEVQEAIRFSAAAAALKATKTGGQAGIPTREKVETFLKSVSSPT